MREQIAAGYEQSVVISDQDLYDVIQSAATTASVFFPGKYQRTAEGGRGAEEHSIGGLRYKGEGFRKGGRGKGHLGIEARGGRAMRGMGKEGGWIGDHMGMEKSAPGAIMKREGAREKRPGPVLT